MARKPQLQGASIAIDAYEPHGAGRQPPLHSISDGRRYEMRHGAYRNVLAEEARGP
jgi:hypothetical protein